MCTVSNSGIAVQIRRRRAVTYLSPDLSALICLRDQCVFGVNVFLVRKLAVRS
ncbi:hypothetical protein B0G77_8863 [Paraburkholderia sp. BL10I2N1]|nr:hypothetical protein B0G77_8863 [Paraburkholderia sp. BL10I2N1]